MRRLHMAWVCTLVVAVGVLLALAGDALAADLTWDTTPGDGGSTTDGTGTWSDGAGNWNTGSGDTNWSNATPDNAVIGSGGIAGTITLGSAVTVGTITFNAVTGSYNVVGGGNTLTLNTAVSVTNGQVATISAPLAGGGDVLKNGTGTLIVSGDNSALSRGFREVSAGILRLLHINAMGGMAMHSDVVNGATLEVDGGLTGITHSVFLQGGGVGGNGALRSLTGDNVFSGRVSLGNYPRATVNVDAGGSLTLSQGIRTWPSTARGITKIGDGTLVLNGNDADYAAGTLLKAGAIRTGAAGALGSGGVTIDGGTLDLNAVNRTLPYLSGSGGNVTDSGAAGTTGLSINQSTNTSYAGTIAAGSRTIALYKAGTGTLTMTGTGNTLGAVHSKGGGVLELAGNSTTVFNDVIQVGRDTPGTLNIKDSAVVTFNSNLDVGNPANVAGAVNQSGGTVTYNGPAERFRLGHWPNETSRYNLSGGVLSVTGAVVRVGWDGNGLMTVSGGTLNALNIYVGRSTGGNILSAVGTGVINSTYIGVSRGSGSGSSIHVAEGGVVNVTNLWFGETSGKAGRGTQHGGTVTVTGQFRLGHWGDETSTYAITNGVLALTGTPSGGGEQNGILYVGIDGTGEFVQSNGTVSAAGLVIDNRSDTPGTDLYELSGGTLTLGARGIGGNASTLFEFGGGILKAGASFTGALPMTLTGNGGDATLDPNGNTLTQNGALSGPAGLELAAAGTLVLGGANSYSGTTAIAAGTLKAGNNGAIPFGVGKGDVVVTGMLDVAGYSIGVNGISGTGTIDNATGNGTLTVGNGDASSTFGGTVTDTAGSLSLVKTGAGTFTLPINATYSGTTTVSGGILALNDGQIYNDLGWAGRTITVDNGGTIEVGGWADGDTKGLGRVAFAAANLQLNGGTVRYTGSNTTGRADRGFAIGANGATLDAAGGNTFTIDQGRNFGIVSSSGGTLTLTGVSIGNMTMILPGGGGLVKDGAGTWTISGNNTYSGGTTVNDGTLVVDNAAGSGTGSGAVQVNSGGTLAGGGTIGGPVVLAGKVAPGVDGIATLTVSNSVTILNNSAYAWEGNGTTGDLVDIIGDISLPNTMDVTVSGDLPTPAVALRWTGSNTGATDVSGWTVSGDLRIAIVGNEVHLEPSPGTVLHVR